MTTDWFCRRASRRRTSSSCRSRRKKRRAPLSSKRPTSSPRSCARRVYSRRADRSGSGPARSRRRVKNWEWIKKGVPLARRARPARSGIGQRRRHPPRSAGKVEGVSAHARNSSAAQPRSSRRSSRTFSSAPRQFRDANTREIDSKEEFYAFFTAKNADKPEIHGGFALAHWNGSREVEEQIKNDLKVTIRCIPFDDPASPPEAGICIFSGEPSPRRVVWAKSY